MWTVNFMVQFNDGRKVRKKEFNICLIRSKRCYQEKGEKNREVKNNKWTRSKVMLMGKSNNSRR